MGLSGLACGVVALFGASMIYGGSREDVRMGSILVLAASAVNAYMGSGFLVSTFGIVGGVLGLTWKPEEGAQRALPQT